MEQAQLSRRGFLLAGAGLALAAACGGGDERVSSASSTTRPTTRDPNSLNLILGTYQLVSGSEQRIAFGVLRQMAPVPDGVEVEFAFGPLDGPLGSPMAAVRKVDGIEERPIHVARTTFPEPGRWRAVATVGKERAEAVFEVIDPAKSEVPLPGQKMVSVPTPTTADHRGVEPICTRDPMCPWHDVSLDKALEKGGPVVLIISTPALCQSRVCGPVLEILLGLRQQHEDRVQFIHGEVFTDKTGETTTPVLQALKLPSEPFVFLVGADGIIRERIEGPYDRGEASEALARLVG